MKLLFVVCAIFLLANLTSGFKILDYFNNKERPLPPNPVCGNFTCPYGTVACKKITKPTSDLSSSIYKVYCLDASNKVLDSSFTATDVVVGVPQSNGIEFSGVNNRNVNNNVNDNDNDSDKDNDNVGDVKDDDEEY